MGLGGKVGVQETDHILGLYNSSFVLTPSGRNHIYLGQEGDGGGSQMGGIQGWDRAGK